MSDTPLPRRPDRAERGSTGGIEALPDGRESLQTDLGKALVRFESALGTAWCTDQRESATTASMNRDWGRAEEARANLKREIRLALDRFRAAGVREWRERLAAALREPDDQLRCDLRDNFRATALALDGLATYDDLTDAVVETLAQVIEKSP